METNFGCGSSADERDFNAERPKHRVAGELRRFDLVPRRPTGIQQESAYASDEESRGHVSE